MHRQRIRHINLDALLAEMRAQGIEGLEEQALRIGGVDAAALARMKAKRPIDCLVARRIEWALGKPTGWMDVEHDPLEVPG
ncbi:hypothetical protein EC912_10557 [Luteibacter rhizovicinus]|uniref:Uncharacterized protein n=1 Tax=Luteibacter rhizovicinus TaxID=242606 RepID=A0A4R3YKY4_9GAMM|nr:hypothetical protein [Luteibacter rhizovicinus]TCV93197.1 hypothetical protein EC912_10557 [Luteibacter rhizovicinus]